MNHIDVRRAHLLLHTGRGAGGRHASPLTRRKGPRQVRCVCVCVCVRVRVCEVRVQGVCVSGSVGQLVFWEKMHP